METVRLRAVQQPSRVERLLVAFASSSGLVASDAYLVRDCRVMPPVLQGIISEAVRRDHAYCCWRDDARQVWVLIGQISLARSRECGSPVLDIKIYREDGSLNDDDCWSVDRDGKWRRCAVTSPAGSSPDHKR